MVSLRTLALRSGGSGPTDPEAEGGGIKAIEFNDQWVKDSIKS